LYGRDSVLQKVKPSQCEALKVKRNQQARLCRRYTRSSDE
jgi:hypothetical protein